MRGWTYAVIGQTVDCLLSFVGLAAAIEVNPTPTQFNSHSIEDNKRRHDTTRLKPCTIDSVALIPDRPRHSPHEAWEPVGDGRPYGVTRT